MGLFCNNEILSKHNTYYTAPRKYKMHGHEILIQNYYLKSFIMGKKVHYNMDLSWPSSKTNTAMNYTVILK